MSAHMFENDWLGELDELCDRFEAAWKAGSPQHIEGCVAEVAPDRRGHFTSELIGLEVQLRRKGGQAPTVADYLDRFPDLRTEIEGLFLEPTVIGKDRPVLVESSLQPGERIGEFEIISRLKAGGMGVIYKAWQIGLKRLVALKLIRSGDSATAVEIERFKNEAEAAAKLEHSGIVPIFDHGTEGDQHYIAMAFIDGPSLAERVAQGPMPAREAAELVRRVALAVDYAHRQGVIHRDLKPGNILLAPLDGATNRGRGIWDDSPSPAKLVDSAGDSEQPPTPASDQVATGNSSRPHRSTSPKSADATELAYEPKITDFGLAKLLDGDRELTKTGDILGTLEYMPPEQASGRMSNVGAAADVYSLGAILYRLLTGRTPFYGDNPVKLIRQLTDNEPVEPRLLSPGLHRDLETICLKCLAKKPSDRFATAAALAEELHRFLHGEPIHSRPITQWERARKWCQRNPIIAGLSAAVALSLLIGTIVSTYFAVNESKAAARAEQQSHLATERLKHAQHGVYGSQLSLVSSRLTEDPGLAVNLLEDPSRCPDSMREFTWRFFHRLCRRDQLSWTAHGKRVSFLVFSPNGKTLITGSHDSEVRIWDAATMTLLHTLSGHRQPITAGTISADGKLLVTGDRSGVVKLWDEMGNERATLIGHNGCIFDVAFSSDGERVAAVSRETLLVWATTSGERSHLLKVPSANFWSLSFRPDSEMLVIGGTQNETTMQGALWLCTGEDFSDIVQSPNFDFGGFSDIEFASDGTTLIGLTNAGALVEINLSTFQLLAHERKVAQTGVALALSRGGENLATASLHGLQVTRGYPPRTSPSQLSNQADWELAGSDYPRQVNASESASESHYQAVRLWERGVVKPKSYIHGISGGVYCLAFSPDGRLLGTGKDDGGVTIYDVTPQRERATFRTDDGIVGNLHFSPNGSLLSGTSRNGIVLWNVTTGENQFEPEHTPKHSVAFAPDGSKFAEYASTSEEDFGIRIREISSTHVTPRTLRDSIGALSPIFSNDGKSLASVTKDQDHNAGVKVWDTESGNVRSVLAHSSQADGLCFSPNSLLLAATIPQQDAGSIRLWDVTNGNILSTLEASSDAFLKVISSDGKLIAALDNVDSGSRVKLWNTASGQLRQTLAGCPRDPMELIFSPDSATLVVVAHSNSESSIEVKQWDVRTGKVSGALTDRMPQMQSIAVSPDSSTLAIAGGEMHGPQKYGEIILWDIAARKERARLKGHKSVVYSLAFSPDCKTLASGSFDFSAKLWDATTGLELTTLEGHRSTVLSVAFSPNGHYLATASYDETVRLWAAPPASETLPPWPLWGTEAFAFGQKPQEQDRGSVDTFAQIVKFKESLDHKRRAASENPSNLSYPRELAEGYFALAGLQYSMHQRAVAASTLKQALLFRQKLAVSEPKNVEHRIKLAECQNELGDLQRKIGELDEAMANIVRAVEIQKTLVDENADDLNRHSKLGGSLNNLSMILQAAGKHPESLAHIQQAIHHQRIAFEAAPQIVQYRSYLWNHYSNLAQVHQQLKHATEAAEAAIMCKRLISNDPNRMYSVAQIMAQCVQLVSQDRAVLSDEDRVEKQKYVDLTLQTLREAIALGFDQFDVLQRDPAFNSISDEIGFKQILPKDEKPYEQR